ncbi:MAG: hypothetical protein QNJ97_03780 [Myxococcota bacterium]|nr:hypothetical protein [Myxococcota bacterium]
MKTTVNIPDPILKQAKQIAIRNNTSLKQVIIEALRSHIEQSSTGTSGEIEFFTCKGNGLRQGLSWDSWSEIQEMAYHGRGGRS